ncbi:Cytochrome P450 71A9 [Glycine soja]|uniref:Cytochrome P450 71A9-like protein n=1 Tax=Glycine soja TaxID=3848 RepID=A0A0B2PRZ0_GLYSO|nr:hypothetical protein JHK87_047025 [Glycine soja]KHN10454.1 Cytochrome P450 71A9-like protein [Glycine soja]
MGHSCSCSWGSIPTLVVSSTEMAREIFKNRDSVFSGRPSLHAANRLGYNGSTVSFAPYGEYWREMRKIMILELLSPKRVQSFQAVRLEEREKNIVKRCYKNVCKLREGFQGMPDTC